MSEPIKYYKAIVLILDHFQSTKIIEKRFSYTELDKATKWLAPYDYGNNVCLCYEMEMQ